MYISANLDSHTDEIVIDIDLDDRAWEDTIDRKKFSMMSSSDIGVYCQQYRKYGDQVAVEVASRLVHLQHNLLTSGMIKSPKQINMGYSPVQNFQFKVEDTKPSQPHLLTQKEYMQNSKFEYLKSRTQAYQDKIAKLEKAHAFWNTTGLILLCSLALCFFVAWMFIVPIVLGLLYVAHNRKRLAKQIAQNEGYLSMIENQVMDLKDDE